MVVKEEKVASGDMFADYIEWRAEAPLRRPDDHAAQRRVRGRARRDAHAHPPGGTHLHGGARRGRQRDHRPAHRLARQAARRTSRPAPPDRRGPLAHPEGDRRDAAVRADRPRGRPLRHTRRRVPRHDDPGGQPRAAVDGIGQPRPAALHQSGRLRHPPRRHHAPHVRVRPALLPRRQPRPARRQGRARRTPQPVPGVGRRLQRHASSRPPRPCAAGTTCRSCSADSR